MSPPRPGDPQPVAARAPVGLVVWRDRPATGPWNMAADEVLAAAAQDRGEVLLRLYGWQPETISLGAFQSFAEAEQQPNLAGWSVVRRPSGGGAIVHGTDLTYCLALPGAHPWSRRAEDLYAAVHRALVEELQHRGVAAAMVDAEAAARVPATDFFCFNRRSFGDVIVESAATGTLAGGWKILGSAQRRLAGVVLQHGSLLLRRHPGMSGVGSHPGVCDLVKNLGDDSSGLVESWLRRLAARFAGPLQEISESFCSGDEPDLHRRIRRYSDDAWLRRR